MRRIWLLIAVILVFSGVSIAQDDDSAGELTQTYTSEDGAFSFDYPAAWVVLEASAGNQIIIGSSEDALQPRVGAAVFSGVDLIPVEGELALRVEVAVEDSLLPITLAGSPSFVAGQYYGYITGLFDMASMLSANLADVTLITPPDTLSVGGKAGALLEYEVDILESDVAPASTVHLLLMVVALDDNVYGFLEIVVPPDGLEAFVPTLTAIAASLTYNETP